MCDYSLMGVPNRLATEGEHLITYRFTTGAVGMATSEDVLNARTTGTPATPGFWRSIQALLNYFGARQCVTAVCIPPGARVRLEGIPRRVQREVGVTPIELATFTQFSAEANRYRDAVRFENGRETLLQDLGEGTHAHVVDLSTTDLRDPVVEHGYAYTPTPNIRTD